MYALVRESDNMIIDWSKDTPFVPGVGEFQVIDKFNFEPSVIDAQWRYLGEHKFEFRYYKDGRDLANNEYSYADFISLIEDKDLVVTLQYKEVSYDSGTGYYLFFEDGSDPLFCRVNPIDHVDEISDFETNYKSGANKSLRVRRLLLSSRREIRNADIASAGNTGIWQPADGKSLVLFDVHIFGQANASTSSPILIKIMLKVGSTWYYIGGVTMRSSDHFSEHLAFPEGLASALGDGTTYMLGVDVTTSVAFSIYVSAFGNTL